MKKDLPQTDLREAALEYHRYPTPGKVAVQPTKGLTNQLDLALAYSPGVAFACHAIVDDPGSLVVVVVDKRWNGRLIGEP
ncbi:MAG TPA: hypothetical protein DHV85_25610 [Candidatus Accumulibacter sp.]|nr:hypothetical protein [Accumulibacter sp.]